ncbi:MAG: hypothetical protein MUF83_01330 [Acidimicrobiales bacterium]|jgi:hypothetical protein|nr:hypothetical protein [Acidimicrobiales bacterium]
MTDTLVRPVGDDEPAHQPTAADRFDLGPPGRVVLAALAAGAGVIHLVMFPSHLGESTVEGLGFALAGWVQVALAVGLLLRPARRLLALGATATAALLVVWAVSRTVGLPFGAHAGHQESASLVDLTTVGLEVGFLVGAAVWSRHPRLGVVGPDRGRLLGGATALAVLAVTTFALASPSARDHAAGSHGDHGLATDGHDHGGDTVAADDNGLSLLTNGHQHATGEEPLDTATRAALTGQLSQTAVLVERYPTAADAEAAGYRRAGPYAPGLGAHYVPFDDYVVNTDGDMDPEDLVAPILIYDGTTPDAPIAGYMFTHLGEEAPEGFPGPNDHWHFHTNVCLTTSPDGHVDAPLGADREVTKEQCDAYGGELIANTGTMVHVWSVPGYESSRGLFSEVNPALDCEDGTYYMIPIEELGDKTTLCRAQKG